MTACTALFLIAVIWTFNITVFSKASPWDVFGMLATVGKTPDFSYAVTNLTIGFIFFIIIIAASALVERFFCRYLCPLGAIFAVASKVKIAKILKPRSKCGNCRICTNSCAMGIPLYKADSINSGECINCLKCVTACPRKNVSLSVAGEDVRPLVAGALTVAAMTSMYYTGTFAANASGASMPSTTVSSAQDTSGTDTPASTASSAQTTVNKLYKDGTYEGSGTGFRGGTTTVSVTIKNDKITDISVVSYGDDAPFFNRAYPTISQEIISNQTAEVDAVSGATFSSMGIMQAVADALSKASI